MVAFLISRIASNVLTRLFKPAPPIPVSVSDPAEIRARFRHWQIRVLIATIAGYAIFYFVRANIPLAIPDMLKSLGVNKEHLGRVLSLFGVMYGVAKFINGYLGDRANARVMMAIGLAGSAVLNLCFGLSHSIWALGIFWLLNGWFQGMGYPPCARLITHWFSPKELATKMSWWNSSHQIGGGLIALLCGFLVSEWGWRACFIVPAGIAFLGAIYLWKSLPDTPPSVGLPEVEGTHSHSGEQSRAEFNLFVVKMVFLNKYVWLASITNFFVYTLRYTIFSWAPTILLEAKHVQIIHSSHMMAAFEWAGLPGALVSGWITDRFFGGRAMRVCAVYMALAGLSVYCLWKCPGGGEWTYILIFASAGFFIYGPQCLVSIAAANLATKRAAATAVGLTSIFGYGSTLLSGWGVGAAADRYGWDAVFKGLLGIAAVGVVVAASCWRAKAHGYDD